MAEGKKLVNIVRGDPENLLGDAIIYSKLRDENGNDSKMPAIYITTNFQRYMAMTREKTFGETEETKNLFDPFLRGSDSTFYHLFFDAYNEKEKITSLSDVFEAKSGKTMEECKKSMIEEALAYTACYTLQLKNKIELSKEDFYESENPQKSFLKSLNITQRSIFGRITHHVSQMETAYREDEPNLFMKDEEKLMNLSSDENYKITIEKISALILLRKRNSRDNLLNYGDYLFALKKEALGRCITKERPKFTFD